MEFIFWPFRMLQCSRRQEYKERLLHLFSWYTGLSHNELRLYSDGLFTGTPLQYPFHEQGGGIQADFLLPHVYGCKPDYSGKVGVVHAYHGKILGYSDA